jgi:hypothetical protein
MVVGSGVGIEAKASHVLAARSSSKQGWNSEVEEKVIEIVMVAKGGIIKAIFHEVKPSFSM